MARYVSGQVSVDSTSIGIPLPQTRVGMDPARAVRLAIGSEPIRYRYDGASPIGGIGHLAAAGAELLIAGADAVRQLLMIDQGTPTTVLFTLEAP